MTTFSVVAMCAGIGISVLIVAAGVVISGAWSDEGGPNAGGE